MTVGTPATLGVRIGRFLNGVGYFMTLFAWLPIAMVVLPRLVASKLSQSVLFPVPAETVPIPVSTTPTPPTPTVLAYGLAVAFGLGLLGLVGYIIKRVYVPAILTSSERATNYIANQGLKAVEKIQHASVSKRRRLQLTRSIQFYVKILLAAAPSLLVQAISFTSETDRQMVQLAMYVASLLAVLLFMAAFLLTGRLHRVVPVAK